MVGRVFPLLLNMAYTLKQEYSCKKQIWLRCLDYQIKMDCSLATFRMNNLVIERQK